LNELRNIARELAEELRRKAHIIEALGKDPVKEVTANNLDEVLDKYELVFLYFTAEWCGPCISFLNTIRNVASEVTEPGIYWGKVDVDRSFTIADRYGINHIPSMLVFHKGKIIDSFVGTISRDKLVSKVNEYIQSYLSRQ